MLPAKEHLRYIEEFISAYKEHGGSVIQQELACQRVRLRFVLEELHGDEFFAGRLRSLAIGLSPQEAGMNYFINEEVYTRLCENVSAPERERLISLRAFWEQEVTSRKVRRHFPPELRAILDSDDFISPGIGFPLYRIGGLHPDYDKLVRLGIPGLRGLIQEKILKSQGEEEFLAGMLEALELFSDTLYNYASQARRKGMSALAEVLDSLVCSPPKALREAIQLIHLYAVITGALNYGRLDVILGDYAGKNEEEEINTLIEFWKVIGERQCLFDGRVIVGGLGRRNEKAADRLALLAIKASKQFQNPLPQLTLRFHDGQNPELLEAAYDNFADGWIYPILYRDEINIPAVANAFDLDEQTAEQYLPFGCGEYIINHQSIGSPSGVINLLKALEATLFNGYDLIAGKKMGRSFTFNSFEELLEAFQKNVEAYIDALAIQEKIEYDVAGQTAPHLLLSMLYDDCIERGKPLLAGGVRYLGGTLESYGNTNTADSLMAIKKTVYDEKIFTIEQLREMLRCNFEGYEHERRILLSCPKYGNDCDEADAVARRVHEHICLYAKSRAKKAGLHSYLLVIINNSCNTVFGGFTGASADGRLAGEPMANANNPAGGMDKNGLTAFLNSIVKLDNQIHAGAVQNIKLSKEMFTKYRPQTKALLSAYFQKGQQAMLNILNKGELEDAVTHPELYPNLIVRVGGFSARFTELDKKVQKEIISRTLHGNDF